MKGENFMRNLLIHELTDKCRSGDNSGLWCICQEVSATPRKKLGQERNQTYLIVALVTLEELTDEAIQEEFTDLR